MSSLLDSANLYFSAVVCRKLKKVGKHWAKARAQKAKKLNTKSEHKFRQIKNFKTGLSQAIAVTAVPQSSSCLVNGASCVEPTRFTRARHSSRSCARGSIAAESRPSWSRSRLTTSIQRVRGASRGRFQPNEPGSKSRIAREAWCGGMRSTCPYQRTRRGAAKEVAGGCPARALTVSLETGRATECQESI